MSSEAENSIPDEGLVKTAENMLRKAIAQYDLNNPVVIERFKLYLDLMQRSGKGDQVKPLEEQANLLKEKVSHSDSSVTGATLPIAQAPYNEPSPDPGAKGGPATRQDIPNEPSPKRAAKDDVGTRQDTPADAVRPEVAQHLYNSKGKHIATRVGKLLYTPSGQYLGLWSEELEVFIDKTGWYIGRISDNNRLERETNWKFRNVNFGKQSSAGFLPGWKRQPDIGYFQLSAGCEDVNFDKPEDTDK